MELAGLLDITVEQGSTFSLPLTLEDGNGAIDLTGAIARMEVRKPRTSDVVLLTLTTENGRINIDGSTGEVTLGITDEDTTALTFKRGVYDLELVYSNGTVGRWLEGRFLVSRETTR